MTEQNAFEALNARENDTVHRITPDVRQEGTGDDAVLIITLPLAEIAKSRKGANRRGALGFNFGPIAFTIDNNNYRLYPGWTSLTRR